MIKASTAFLFCGFMILGSASLVKAQDMSISRQNNTVGLHLSNPEINDSAGSTLRYYRHLYLNFVEGGGSTTHNLGYFSNDSNSLSGLGKFYLSGDQQLGGRLGIKTSGIPSADLQVNGTVNFSALNNDNAAPRILASDASGNIRWRDATTFGGAAGWAQLGNNIYNTATGFVILGGSNYSGTPDADLRLAVNGNIYCRKVKVTQLGWADYVFNDNYRLPAIPELAIYIRQHKHLPDVPSAAEVQKDGLDIGQNQAALLKKIEELTLYIIDLNAKLEKQQKKLEDQDREIAAMKAHRN